MKRGKSYAVVQHHLSLVIDRNSRKRINIKNESNCIFEADSIRRGFEATFLGSLRLLFLTGHFPPQMRICVCEIKIAQFLSVNHKSYLLVESKCTYGCVRYHQVSAIHNLYIQSQCFLKSSPSSYQPGSPISEHPSKSRITNIHAMIGFFAVRSIHLNICLVSLHLSYLN